MVTGTRSSAESPGMPRQLFQRLLLHIDSFHPASPLDRVAGFAVRAGASVTVAAVVPELSSAVRRLFPARLTGMISDRQQEDLAGAVAYLRDRGVAAEPRLLNGQPTIALVREVLRGGFQMVVRPHDAAGSPGRMRPYGPLDMQLLRKCPVPVWLVTTQPCRHVMAAVDVGGEADQESFNLRILDVALAMAEAEAAAITVLHVWHLFAEALLRGHLTADEVSEYEERSRNDSARALERLIERLGPRGVHVRARLVKGNARVAIPRLAEADEVDLVVMGTLGRAGILGYLIGNTAEAVLRQLRCSLIALKPEGFVSPVVPVDDRRGAEAPAGAGPGADRRALEAR